MGDNPTIEALEEWVSLYPLGTKILWCHPFSHEWLPGVVLNTFVWKGLDKLDASVAFRLDTEPEPVKGGNDHRIHWDYRDKIKTAS